MRLLPLTEVIVPLAIASLLAVPTADARPRKAPRWSKVTITVACDDAEADVCRGNHGFTVAADGTYTVGPEPGGKTITDQLSADELAMITKHAESLARTSSKARMTCDKHPAAPGNHPTVTLTRADGTTLTIFQASVPGKGSRCTVGSRPKVIELETTLGLLLALHYPLPFPS